jgi:uncharacterized protein YgbK (DUF1537 family)
MAISKTKVVFLHDDPTGTQTVHNVQVLNDWTPQMLATALRQPGATVHISTNSRSMPLSQAQEAYREIAANLQAASELVDRKYTLVSQGDSALRGHYPGEVEALAEGMGRNLDGVLLVPCSVEAGHVTIGDVHYVEEGDSLLPVGATEYAQDPIFQYQNSNLRAWVSEKYHGAIHPAGVASISLDHVRTGGPGSVAGELTRLRRGQICVANAVTYRDLEVLVAGLQQVEAMGRRYLCRAAASFVRVRAAMLPGAPLAPPTLRVPKGGGLIIVGALTKSSTLQVQAVRALPGLAAREVYAEDLLDPVGRDAEIERIVRWVDKMLVAGQDVMVHTNRRLIARADRSASMMIGQSISAALAAVVSRMRQRPAWIIAVGGVTAADIAVKGLQAKRAHVLGHAIVGIPIWEMCYESIMDGLIYVVFPGSVGGPDTLAEMINILHGAAR